MDVQKVLDEINVLIKQVTDPVAKAIISQLLNIIEYQAQEIKILKEENQKLRDENNRLKGEQSKPNIRAQSIKNISSGKECNQHGKGKFHKRSKSKNHKIKINKTVRCKINPEKLSDDAVFKGYKTVIVQDISIKTSNIKFRKEVYYSPSQNKTFTAHVPFGYEGEFGPHIKSLIITHHFKYKMTEPAIVEFLQDLETLAQKELPFEFNESAYALMGQFGLSAEVLTKITDQLKTSVVLNR